MRHLRVFKLERYHYKNVLLLHLLAIVQRELGTYNECTDRTLFTNK